MSALDQNTFAIGDIHGRFDLLTELLGMIEGRADNARIIFLGDYIDRGPQSREVIETLMAGPQRKGDEWTCLKGNHEAMMLETIRAPLDYAWWCGNGGSQTLASFNGIIPNEVLDWCAALPVSHETENHFFVHAGIRPDIALGAQNPEEVMWIRDLFLDWEKPHPKHIVHGHTPNDHAELMPNRTNLDSGAKWTGRLSAGWFDLTKAGGPKEILTTQTP